MTSRIDYNNPYGVIGALGLPYHYEMVSDLKRTTPFKKAIQKTCKDKIVLDSGTGTGIFSILAARAGAERVYAIEIDPAIHRFAEENIKKSGLQEKIKLILGNTRNITLADLDGGKVDVVIAENLSTWQVTEPQIPILNHVNKYLIKSDGVRIPLAIYNYAELAQSIYRFEDAVDLRAMYFGFSGVREPSILSDKILFKCVSLSKINSIEVFDTMCIPVSQNGIFNSIRLTSPIDLCEYNIKFGSSDSLMPPVIVPLNCDIPVSCGDIVKVIIRYEYGEGWENFKCSAYKTA